MSDLTHNSTIVPSVSTATNVIYVGKYGTDLNNGTSPEKAKLTIGSAITEAVAKTPSSTNRFDIRVLDSAIYEENLVLPTFVDLEAPCAIIKSTSGTALEFSSDTTVGLLGIEVSDGAIGLKYNDSSSNFGYFKCRSILATGTSHGIVLLEGKSSVCVDIIEVSTGTGVRLSETTGPYPATNTHIVKFDVININGAGKGIEINGTNDVCRAVGLSMDSSNATALGFDINDGKCDVSMCSLNINGGRKYDVEANGTLNLITADLTRSNIAGEFDIDGLVSSFVGQEEVQRYKAQTTSDSLVEVHRVTLQEGDMYGFSVQAVGKRDDELAGVYQNVANAFRRAAGGSCVRIGTQDGDGLRETDSPLYEVQFTTDGNNAVISVKGAMGDTLDWDIKITEVRKDG